MYVSLCVSLNFGKFVCAFVGKVERSGWRGKGKWDLERAHTLVYMYVYIGRGEGKIS